MEIIGVAVMSTVVTLAVLMTNITAILLQYYMLWGRIPFSSIHTYVYIKKNVEFTRDRVNERIDEEV